MTSLEMLPERPGSQCEQPEWGTGETSRRVPLWIAKRPTWQYDGHPVEQFYTLTPLKLSNVRINDELIPRPQQSVIGDVMINRPFPAEHPYTSHIPRMALFPDFVGPDDPQTGTAARARTPKSAHVPADNHQVVIVAKTKGSGARHEIQKMEPESDRKPLTWLDGSFDHYLKYPDATRQRFYPTPVQLLAPNPESRDGALCTSARTADTAHNVRRDQWCTTYEREHAGLGPANPNQLDNYNDKHCVDNHDQKLWPRSLPTFDPARPVEGRISAAISPRPTSQPQHVPTLGNKPLLSLSEREEHRLLHGNYHTNLPADDFEQHPDDLPCSPETQLTSSRSQPTMFYNPEGNYQQELLASCGPKPQLPTLSVANATQPSSLVNLPVKINMDRLQNRYSLSNQFPSQLLTPCDNSSRSCDGLRMSYSHGAAAVTSRPRVLLDLSFKDDQRFQWRPTDGTPRPTSCLRQIQDSFRRSDVRKQFHSEFPENAPDLRVHTAAGKRHVFAGFNAQILRGTPVSI